MRSSSLPTNRAPGGSALGFGADRAISCRECGMAMRSEDAFHMLMRSVSSVLGERMGTPPRMPIRTNAGKGAEQRTYREVDSTS